MDKNKYLYNLNGMEYFYASLVTYGVTLTRTISHFYCCAVPPQFHCKLAGWFSGIFGERHATMVCDALCNCFFISS